MYFYYSKNDIFIIPKDIGYRIMKDLFTRSAKVLCSEKALFLILFLLVIARLYPVLQTALLSGWDTLPHFYALEKMAEEFLPSGHISGYVMEWFGGFSLFTFYGPLFYILVAGIWIATFKIFSLSLLFRAGILLVLLGFCVSFWYFLKTFAGKGAAKIGILLCMLFVFYPTELSPMGIGAGGAFFMGLFNGIIGLSLVLLFFSFLENLRKSLEEKRPSVMWTVLSVISLAALLFSHTLSLFGGIFLGIIYFFIHVRNLVFLKKIGAVLFLALLIASPFIIPFLGNIGLSAGSPAGIGSSMSDPFLYVFPFDLQKLSSLEGILSFEFWALIFLFFSVAGFVAELKEKRYFIPLSFILSLLFLSRNYFLAMFPKFAIHYYRFLPFVFVLALMLASIGVRALYERAHGSRNKKIAVGILVFFMIFQSYALFSVNASEKNRFSLFGETYIPYHWNIEDYGSAKEGAFLLERLKVYSPQRVIVEPSPVGYLSSLGSTHYFTGMIPMKNGQSTLYGLYAESSGNSPFIFSSIEGLLQYPFNWGDVRLSSSVPSFFSQPPEYHVKRLAHFGMDYFVAFGEKTRERISSVENAKLIEKTNNFAIYSIQDHKELAYPAKYKPALYINLDRALPFREIALAAFDHINLIDFPIADGGSSLARIRENAPLFSVIIVSASSMSEEEKNTLLSLPNPLVLLNANPAIYDESRGATTIDGFRELPYPVSLYALRPKPGSWESFQNALVALKERFLLDETSYEPPSLFTNTEIRYTGYGPMIINAGYFPYWKKDRCASGNCAVWRVTPDQMLVFSDGLTVLHYEPNVLKKVLMFISYGTIAGLLIFAIVSRASLKKKKSV